MYDSNMWQGVLDTMLFDKVSKWLTDVTSFPDCPLFSTNKTDHHVIILKVVTPNTLTLTLRSFKTFVIYNCAYNSWDALWIGIQQILFIYDRHNKAITRLQ